MIRLDKSGSANNGRAQNSQTRFLASNRPATKRGTKRLGRCITDQAKARGGAPGRQLQGTRHQDASQIGHIGHKPTNDTGRMDPAYCAFVAMRFLAGRFSFPLFLAKPKIKISTKGTTK